VTKPAPQISYRSELGRKSIHLFSTLIPLIGWFVHADLRVGILSVMTLFSLAMDVERSLPGKPGKLIQRWLGHMIRPHERRPFLGILPMTGATWLLVAATLCYTLFTREVATASLLLVIWGDAAAALIGRRYGRIRFGPNKKSVEGTLAFFAFGTAIVAFIPGLPVLVGLIGAAVAAIVEALPWELDDNFAVPLIAGVVMSLL
jgi:dolichol kinase